eukprot:33765-Pleurochrysis_carterae.AAC.1
MHGHYGMSVLLEACDLWPDSESRQEFAPHPASVMAPALLVKHLQEYGDMTREEAFYKDKEEAAAMWKAAAGARTAARAPAA